MGAAREPARGRARRRALALLTRCLHLDGLADTADGLGSGAPAARALEIMRQSDIGPFGVVALIFVLGADVAALGSPCRAGRGRRSASWRSPPPPGGSPPSTRPSAVSRRPAGPASGASSPATFRVAAAVAWTAGVLGLGAAVAIGLSIPVGWVLVPQAVALAAAYLFRLHAVRRLGGVTGDVFGALIESATAVTLIGVALR